MKKIVFFLFIFMSYFSYGQKTQPQSFNYTAPQIFSDSVKMNALGGSGLILGITEDGVLIKKAGTSTDTINISQVLGLQDSLALKQAILSFDSNFVFTNNKIDLNDTIWTEVGIFSKRSVIKNTVPLIELNETDGSLNNKRWRLITDDERFRIRALSDAGESSGDFVDFTRSGSSITSFRMLSSGTPSITLKNSGTGVFEDTVRSGQLKVAGILYPIIDGTSGQVLTTNGSGVATFSDVTSPLIAGTNITISGDTISSTGGSDADWTVNGNYVYNLSDSIGIGVSNPDRALEISGQTKMSSSGTSTLEINNSVTGVGVDINSSIGSGISILSNKTFGYGIDLNSYQVDSISNDNTLVGADERALVTEQAVKGYVDNRILNDTRVSWAADVDTSTRADGFVLKWNNGTKTHYYDTAGAGGGGGTYFAGAGLQLAANVFSIDNDGVETSMIQDDAVTYSKIQNVGGNSILARAASGSGDLSEVSLASSRLLGRGSTGNVAAISLGSGLLMSGTTLSATNTGTVTNVISGNGLNFTDFTTSGTITLGTPQTTSISTTNQVLTNSHTHQLDLSGRTLTAGDGLTGGGTLGANITFTLGTPQTLTGTTTNAVLTNSHTHALDFTTFQNNIRTFYFDTARVIGDDAPLIGGKMPITNQEKVIAFTMSTEADNVLLGNGYYTIEGMVDIEIINDDTTSGVAGFFQNYQLNVYVTDDAQFLANTLTGTTAVIETAEANATPQSISDQHGDPLDGTIRLHLVTTPIKFYLDGTQFVALTIKANYPSPADFVSHKRATMRVTRAVDYDSTKEQLPDITAP